MPPILSDATGIYQQQEPFLVVSSQRKFSVTSGTSPSLARSTQNAKLENHGPIGEGIAYTAPMMPTTGSMFLLRGILRHLAAAANGCSVLDGLAMGMLVALVDSTFGIMHPFFDGTPVGLYLMNHAFHLVALGMAGALLSYSFGG